MNLIPGIMLTAVGTASGLYFSMKLKKRKQTLEQAVLFTDELKIKISYQSIPVSLILSEAAKNKSYDMLSFLKYAAETDENGDFHKRWSDGVEAMSRLSQEDKSILLALGGGLGSSDADGQLTLLQTHKALLERQLAAADDEYIRKGKMVRSVGILCGLAAGIAVL